MPSKQPIFFSYFKHELLLHKSRPQNINNKINKDIKNKSEMSKTRKDSPQSMLFFSPFHHSVFFSKDIIQCLLAKYQ